MIGYTSIVDSYMRVKNAWFGKPISLLDGFALRLPLTLRRAQSTPTYTSTLKFNLLRVGFLLFNFINYQSNQRFLAKQDLLFKERFID
jgi:hypothetical protein